ncbi:MAG: hypothetical protein ACYC9O_16335 [Candidatus Latescibacterota bacterium]
MMILEAGKFVSFKRLQRILPEHGPLPDAEAPDRTVDGKIGGLALRPYIIGTMPCLPDILRK